MANIWTMINCIMTLGYVSFTLKIFMFVSFTVAITFPL
jgi:hypothetical protein